eukprot:1177050-Pyramimonas_sp.AAC.1
MQTLQGTDKVRLCYVLKWLAPSRRLPEEKRRPRVRHVAYWELIEGPAGASFGPLGALLEPLGVCWAPAGSWVSINLD